MLTLSQEALQRWHGFDQSIDRWLEERHELIILLSDFASRREFCNTNPQLVEKLHLFRSLLIDYISAGHFAIFQRLLEEGRTFEDHRAVEHGCRLLASIQPSTRLALAFDEKYENFPGTSDLVADLSTLAEALVSRFHIEDQMIGILHDRHMALAAVS